MSVQEAQRRIAECRENRSDELDLSGLRLERIPEEVGELVWLIRLDLSRNQLIRIEGFDTLGNLEVLHLYFNQISRIEGLDVLANLKYLYLQHNKISCIEGLDALTSLQGLILYDNKINDIKGLEYLVGLQKLDLSYNKITSIECLNDFKILQELYLRGNQLSRIDGLEDLIKLQTLNLSNNQINRIEGLETLVNIQTLNLNNNQINRIEGLDALINLQGLCLDDNKINRIEGLDALVILQELHLGGNHINRIEGVDAFNSLQLLSLNDNKINQVEDFAEILNLTNLNWLVMNDNPVFQKYGLILDEDWHAGHLDQVKQLIDQKDSYKKMSLPRRVMLLGNHAAGKSSLMHYIEQQQLCGSSKSTHGLEVKPLYIKDKNQDVPKSQDNQLPEAIFFDFGGQDYYHGICRVFLRQQSSRIVLVNPKQNTNKTCDENSATVDNPKYTQDFSLDYWAAQLRYFQVDSDETAATQDTFLVQSHADLEPQQQWQYAQCLQDRLIGFDLLTLKEQPEPLNQLALEHFRQSLIQHITSSQHAVFQTDIRKEQIRYILNFWQTGRATYRPLNVKGLNEKINGKKYPLAYFKLDLEQLSKAGLVWYDQKNVNEDVVWLHPKGLVDHLYQKLLAPARMRNATKQGVLSQKSLNDLKLHSATIELLEFYQIIFKHQPHKDDSKNVEYIIPNYLPLSKQDKALHNISTFGLEQPTFRLRFTHFMPMGLINQAICFFGCQPDDKLFWRDLMVFTLSEGLQGRYRVMLRLDFSQLEISVCIQPEQSSYKATEYQKVKQYLFYCLMRFYWDLHANDSKPATFEHFVSIVINHDAEYPEDGWGNRFEQYRFHRPLWRKFYRDQSKHDKPSDELKFVPDDLYVSLGTDTWVHYRDLVKHPADETYIQRYQLESQPDQPTTFTVKGQTQAKPFEVFLNRELRAVKKIFISYSRKDVEYKDELALFLKTTLCRHGHEVWDCGMLEEGKWDEQIQNKLLEADLVILMLSINFFSSNYIVQHELLKTLERIDQGHSQQKMMCIVVKTFPWDSFAQLAKHSKISPENLGQYQRAYLQEDVVQHQFLPYRKQVNSSINTENRELLVPLAKIHPNERDDVYSDIVGRVMKALDIAQ